MHTLACKAKLGVHPGLDRYPRSRAENESSPGGKRCAHCLLGRDHHSSHLLPRLEFASGFNDNFDPSASHRGH